MFDMPEGWTNANNKLLLRSVGLGQIVQCSVLTTEQVQELRWNEHFPRILIIFKCAFAKWKCNKFDKGNF